MAEDPIRTVNVLTQVVGRAENAFGALLRQVLTPLGATFHQWVSLSVLTSQGGTLAGERLSERVADALKIDTGLVTDVVTELAAGGFVRRDVESGEIALTERGRGRFDELRRAIAAATGALHAQLSDEDIATTRRVLESMTARANAQLVRAQKTGLVDHGERC